MMKKKPLLFIITLIGCIVLSNTTISAAATADATSFQFEPPVFILNITQGSSEKRDIFIENKSNTSPLNASLYVNNFRAENGGSTVSFFSSTNKDDDIASWVKPELSAITLKPQEGQYETLDIAIPSFVKSGTYTGILFIDPATQAPQSGIGTAIHGRAGINMILNIYKNDSEYTSLYKSGIFTNLAVPFIRDTNSVPIAGNIKNTGHFIISDDVSITINTIIGKHVKSLVYKEIHTLPGQYRYLDGSNKIITVSGLSLGIYKATFLLLDNLKGTTATKTLYFTVVPLYFIIIGTIIIIAILLLIVYALYRRKHPKYTKGI